MQALLQLFPCCRFCLSHNHILPGFIFFTGLCCVWTALLSTYKVFLFFIMHSQILLQEMQPFHRSSHRPFCQILPLPEVPDCFLAPLEYGLSLIFAHSEIHRHYEIIFIIITYLSDMTWHAYLTDMLSSIFSYRSALFSVERFNDLYSATWYFFHDSCIHHCQFRYHDSGSFIDPAY